MVLALSVVVGCHGTSSPRSNRPAQRTVALPDISSADEPVQAQIRQRFASLQDAIGRPGLSQDDLASAFGEMGTLLTAAEYYDAAGACFDNARVLAPRDMRWPYLLGHTARLANDTATASSWFEQALALSPEHVPSLVWLAQMHLEQSRADAAAPLLARAASLEPGSGAVAFGLGRVALARNDFAQAVQHLERALTLGPHANRIRYPLALAYRGLGQRAKAEEHLRQRGEVDLPPDDPLLAGIFGLLQNASAYEVRGSRAIEEQRWPDAAASLRKAIELAPENAFSRLNLATSLYMLGDADAALDQYRAAIRLSPGLARAHFGVGVLMEARGRDGEAIDAFTTAVAIDRAYVEARFSLANALRRAGRVRESLPHYEDVIRMAPAVSQAGFGYAMGLVRLGRHQEARARLEAGAHAFPGQRGFPHALARLLAASPDDRVRDGNRAVGIMTDLVKTEKSMAVAETMAMALAEVRRFDDAVEWQRNAITAAQQGQRQDLAERLTVNLQRYENRQPCRTPWTDDDPVHHPGR
jgi:tetratricopeptide (TPR) repeat protein